MSIEVTCFNMTKSMYDKLTVNIILNSERLKVSLKIRNKISCQLSLCLFKMVLKSLAIAIRPKKREILKTPIWKEKRKTAPWANLYCFSIMEMFHYFPYKGWPHLLPSSVKTSSQHTAHDAI